MDFWKICVQKCAIKTLPSSTAPQYVHLDLQMKICNRTNTPMCTYWHWNFYRISLPQFQTCKFLTCICLMAGGLLVKTWRQSDTWERYTMWRLICSTKDKISLNGSFTRMRILPTITRIRFDASGYFSSSAIQLCASGHVSYLNENYVVPCICLRAIWHMHGSMWHATLE